MPEVSEMRRYELASGVSVVTTEETAARLGAKPQNAQVTPEKAPAPVTKPATRTRRRTTK